MQDQLARHERDVAGAREVPLGGQARAVDKVRVVHAELLRPRVHALHEGVLAAGKMLGERHRRVVARDDAHSLEQVAHRHLFVLLEPDLAAAHASRVRRARHHVVVGERAGVDGLHHQQQRHDLRHARRLARRVFILREEHRAGLLFHQQRARTAHRRPRRRGADAQGEGCQQRKYRSFHGMHSFLCPLPHPMPPAGGIYGKLCRQANFALHCAGKSAIIASLCRVSTSVVHRLPKPRRRVRFPYPAPKQKRLAMQAASVLESRIGN